MFLKAYLISLPIFLALDMLWINGVAKSFYQEQIGYLLADQPNIPAAVVFYLLYLSGLIYFVVQPAIEAKSPKSALARGGFFGLITYATYDLTNHATVKDWPAILTFVDMIWGTVLCGSVAFATYLVATWRTPKSN